VLMAKPIGGRDSGSLSRTPNEFDEVSFADMYHAGARLGCARATNELEKSRLSQRVSRMMCNIALYLAMFHFRYPHAKGMMLIAARMPHDRAQPVATGSSFPRAVEPVGNGGELSA
jgi:hypothetical protein